MSTWLQAHRVANLTAAQAHADLEIDPGHFPIDVYGAIGTARISLLWRPLPQAFGMYLNSPGSRPGILLNNRLSRAVQRHTAGHELGHHLLGHGNRVDLDLELFESTRRGWSQSEKTAEAFAVWFLMPRRAATAAMRVLGLSSLRGAEDVYLLSLLLGTSYRSTARHLLNLRLCTPQQSTTWMAVPPNRIKDRVDPGCLPSTRVPDVWRVDRRLAGRTLTACTGDRLVLELDGQRAVAHATTTGGRVPVHAVPVRSAGRRDTKSVASAGGHLVVEVASDPAEGTRTQVLVGELSDPRNWWFELEVEPTRWGPARPPEPVGVGSSPDRHSVTITPVEEGLL